MRESRAGADAGNADTAAAATARAATGRAGTGTAVSEARRLADVRWSAALGALVIGANLTVINVAVADIRESFPSAQLSTIGWVVSAYTIVFGAVLVPAGRLGDRLGRRSVFMVGLAIFGAGSILAGAAPTLWLLIIGRGVQGIGAACITPSSMALLLDASPVSERAASTAFYSGVSSVGAAAGPSIGALLVNQMGWRSAFFFGLPVLLVSYVRGRRSLVRSRAVREAGLPDLLGSLMVMATMTGLTFSIVQGRTWGFDDARVITTMLVALLLVPLFVLRCSRHPSPVLALGLFRRRSFGSANVAGMLFGCATGGVGLVNVLFLRDVWGYSLLAAGFGALPSSFVAMGCSPLVGRWGMRFGGVRGRRARACCASPPQCCGFGFSLTVNRTTGSDSYHQRCFSVWVSAPRIR